MRIGCPKEIKPQEGRVGLTPAGVDAFVRAGHTVYMEQGAGLGSGFTDAEYTAVGAEILPDAKSVFDTADMIIKVKEPLEPEYGLLREGQTLFTYLHLAPDPAQTQALLEKKVTAIAYETVQPADGSLPLLAPMSEVAGRLSIQVGAHLLESSVGGRGILLGGVPGVERANVVIIGGGEVGVEAAMHLAETGHDATVLEMRDMLAADTTKIHYRSMFREAWESLEHFHGLTSVTVTGVDGEGVHYTDKDGAAHMAPADSVLVAAGMKAETEAALRFYGTCPEFYLVGDCQKPGTIQQTNRSAFEVANKI